MNIITKDTKAIQPTVTPIIIVVFELEEAHNSLKNPQGGVSGGGE